jgi:hypothetical protein
MSPSKLLKTEALLSARSLTPFNVQSSSSPGSVSAVGLLAINRVSDNAGGVNHFLSVLLRALRRARHFALVEAVAVALAFALPTKARS